MPTHIPISAIIPFFLASFVMLGFQYYRINPERRILELRFGMMLGAIGLVFCTIFFEEPLLSLLFFVLALVWLGTTILLFRHMPPNKG